MIHVECPDCSKLYDVAEELAGKTAKCRECGGRIPIPLLRTEIDTTSERTKPAQAKPTSSKSPSPKASPAQQATSKSAAKPKSAPKKHEEDFFKDDFEEVAEFDDVEEVIDADDDESDEGFPRLTTQSNQSRRKKNAKKNKKSGPSIVSKTLSFFAGSFVWWAFLAGILTCAGFAWSFYSDPLGSRPLAQTVAWVGLPLLFASAIWMIVVTFRVSPGWGITFILAWLGNLGLNVAGHRAIAGGISLLFCAVSLILVVQHWKEFREVFLFQFVLGLFLVTPLAAVMGVDRMRQDFEARIPSAVAPAAGESPKPDASFNLASIPIPRFKEMRLRVIQGHDNALITTDFSGLQAQTPGVLTIMNYWQPVGGHADRSLACVLVASAGSTLLHGATVPDVSYVAETRPYVDAGFAVLGVSLDGPILNKDRATDRDYSRAYEQFRRSGAGTVNVRNAVEFLTNNVPQVDPKRIYIAGHSSAATLALLAAEHEPRLKGCIAYAPATDVVARLKNVIDDSAASRALPGVAEFAKQSSPLTHVSKIGCPVFLFHAADDSNVPVADSRRFAELLKSNGKSVTYVEVPTGNHYDSMIQQGIPRAIPWLKELAGMSGATGAPATQVTPTKVVKSTVPKKIESPTFPNIAPSNTGGTPAGVLQPSGRAVTFRFSTFSGKGDPAAAARQALRNVSWADPDDIVIDQATSEIRIGQLGGSVNSEPARQALLDAGFQLIGGVSIGAKKPVSSTTAEPTRPANAEPAAPIASTPAENPFTTKTSPAKVAPKPTAQAVAEPAAPKELGPPRRVVTFRYERYSGKGSSVNAAVAALRKVKWADPDDIEVDTAKREIRVGQIEESKEYGPAEKSLKDAGFSVTPGVASGLRKR